MPPMRYITGLNVQSAYLYGKLDEEIYMEQPKGFAAPGVSRSEVLGRFYNPNTTPKGKERVVVCLRGTGQELH